MAERTRYAVVGTGSRAGMYIGAIGGAHSDVAELVATIDVNPGRLDYYDRVLADRVAQAGQASASDLVGLPSATERSTHLSRFGGLPAHGNPDDLEKLIIDHRVDRVIVTSPDFTHAEMVTRALDAGADVIVEKPLTTEETGSSAIAKAVRDTGRSLVMTFNYRYSPRNSAFRRVIQSGAIGQPLSVHFEWVLDTAHGADYFRRWHRDKRNTGGLLIHKASHHFDLVNWWIDDVPARVFASGALRFYGAANAQRDGHDTSYARGTVDGVTDPFALDMRRDPTLKALYYDNERYDGYRRDKSVFDAGITIEDNLSLVVDYASGVSMSYSLNAHSPWEGYKVAVNGTRGRVELEVVERGEVVLGADGRTIVDPSAVEDTAQAALLRPSSERILLQQHWQAPQEIEIVQGRGGHGGGDAILLRDVFVGPTDDPLSRAADSIDGVKAIAVGIAGNRSLATGQAVRVADLDVGVDLRELGRASNVKKRLGSLGVNGGPGLGAPYAAPGAAL